MFTFEFDAPKYKCFGGNQPRRSTITAIDSTSSNDLWFLHFNRPNSYQQYFKPLIEQERLKSQSYPNKQQHAVTHKSTQKLSQSQPNQQTKDQSHKKYQKSIQQPSNTNQNPLKMSNNHNQNLHKHQSKKQISKQSHKDLPHINTKSINTSFNTKKQLQNKKQVPIKKPSITNKQLMKPKSKPIQSTSKHQLSLRSVDTKSKKEIQVTRTQLNAPQKNLKTSKSQPLSKRDKHQQKKRNPPCLYPIRIQRQWEQDHGRKWYQLSSMQIVEAEKSMKRRMNRQPQNDKRQNKNHKVSIDATKIKIKNNLKHNTNTEKFVQNPLYVNQNQSKQE